MHVFVCVERMNENESEIEKWRRMNVRNVTVCRVECTSSNHEGNQWKDLVTVMVVVVLIVSMMMAKMK